MKKVNERLFQKIMEVARLIEEWDNAPEVNDGHYLEITDRIHVAACSFEDFINSHPVVQSDPKMKELAEVIMVDMAELYQRAGKKLHNNKN